MEGSVFARSEGSFRPVEIEGLDAAWLVPGGLEAVAVKGDLVLYAEHLGGSPGNLTALLSARAEHG